MKITILNGNPEHTNFDNYLIQLSELLSNNGHEVNHLLIRELQLKYCIGCWDCWVKTPGVCSVADASREIDHAVINSDFVLWAAPLKMGFPSVLLKMGLDKHLPLIHPYIVVDHGEAHHLARYQKYPRVGLLLEKEISTDDNDLHIISDIHCRTALNLKTRLEFCLTTETSAEVLVNRIVSENPLVLSLPGSLSATKGTDFIVPSRLTLFNGSPRGQKGNTLIFLKQIAKGFDGNNEMYHLIQVKRTEEMVNAFANAECVILGFPLYTDSMPASVKHFIEALEPLTRRKNNPPIGFVVQSGFPEGLHSRYIERYLEKLAHRLGSPYLSTIVRGNGEGTRLMPPDMNRKLFENLTHIGASLAKGQAFDPRILSKIASPERFPRFLHPLFRFILSLPVSHGYFDGLLKKNGVYEQRYDQPFLKGE